MKTGNRNSLPYTRFFPGFCRLSPFLIILLLVLHSGCQPQAVTRKDQVASPSGGELFKTKCSKCHDPELALKKYRSEDVWYDTITRMKEEHDADISGREIEMLVNYHVKRQQREAAIFDEKCQKCHPGKVFLAQNLTPEQARAIIKRMQQKAGNTIEDEDVEIIVRYHVQTHEAALQENLRGAFLTVRGESNVQRGSRAGSSRVPPRGVTLFLEKCSTCHEPERALTVIKDPEVWSQTIKRMQYYSKGEITDREVNELVDFHVNEQQREIDTFRQTCTRCHDDKRINSRSMSEEEWLATIKRMQLKAPDLISNEKVALLAAYFHRRELTMARIFYGKCQLCHYKGSWESSSRSGTSGQMNGLIVLANEELGESMEIKDVNILLDNHIQRQKRNMQLFTRDCSTCHVAGIPKKKNNSAKEEQPERSRAEWISFIATLQGVEINKDIQNTINSQIEYHISQN
jgi:cytochrome c5